MIVYANDILKKDVIHIWKTCFPDDSYDFTEFYFRRKYKNENTLVWLENGKAVACLQMLPYNITYFGHILPVAYISGAATLPEFRNKGIMKKLLTFSFQEMQKRQIPLSALIPQEPWLFDFYSGLGYETVFSYSEFKLQSNNAFEKENTYSIEEIDTRNAITAYQFYNGYFINQNVCIQKSFEDFNALIEFYQLENGQILSAISDYQIHALCFVNTSENKIIIKDLIAKNEKAKLSLFHYITSNYKNNEIVLQTIGQENAVNHPKGMLRIIDLKKIMELFTETHTNLTLKDIFNEECFLENKDTFPINNSTYIRLAKNDILGNKSNGKTNINLLTRLLFGYKIQELSLECSMFPKIYPYMSLMLE